MTILYKYSLNTAGCSQIGSPRLVFYEGGTSQLFMQACLKSCLGGPIWLHPAVTYANCKPRFILSYNYDVQCHSCHPGVRMTGWSMTRKLSPNVQPTYLRCLQHATAWTFAEYSSIFGLFKTSSASADIEEVYRHQYWFSLSFFLF